MKPRFRAESCYKGIRAFTVRDDESFYELDEQDRKTAVEWVKASLIATKTANNDNSSYGLKHMLQRATGIYMTNNAFKELMLFCGFEPTNPDDRNWYYRISKRSPGIVRDRERRSQEWR